MSSTRIYVHLHFARKVIYFAVHNPFRNKEHTPAVHQGVLCELSAAKQRSIVCVKVYNVWRGASMQMPRAGKVTPVYVATAVVELRKMGVHVPLGDHLRSRHINIGRPVLKGLRIPPSRQLGQNLYKSNIVTFAAITACGQ